jgi:DNA polymerase-1
MEPEVSSLLVIDGNNLGWRAFGQAPLSFNGQRTEVIKIGLVMLRNYLNLFSPSNVVVVWDGGHDPFRVLLFPNYKRREIERTEEEKRERDLFFTQLSKLRESISKLGVDQICVSHREADDVIFSLLSSRFRVEEQAFVVSTDSDMLQLLSMYPEVVVYSPVKQILYTKDEVEQRFGFPVEYYVMYKALVGDPSDNLPGVRGIGPEKAKVVIGYLRQGIEKNWQPCHRSLEKLWNEQRTEYQKMLELITFRVVPENELREGWIPTSKADITEMVYEISNQYGFDQILENPVPFVVPFQSLHNRRQLMERYR